MDTFTRYSPDGETIGTLVNLIFSLSIIYPKLAKLCFSCKLVAPFI